MPKGRKDAEGHEVRQSKIDGRENVHRGRQRLLLLNNHISHLYEYHHRSDSIFKTDQSTKESVPEAPKEGKMVLVP